MPHTCKHTCTCPLLSWLTDFHKIFCHYRQSEPLYLFIPKTSNNNTVNAQTCLAGGDKMVQSNIVRTYSIVIGTILIQNERQGNAAASDLYLPFSLKAIIINYWNLKFCMDTDHKHNNKFHIRC